jgi:hypothetical protein
VAKWLHGKVEAAQKYRRIEQTNNEALKQAPKADSRQPKGERRSDKALYAELSTLSARPL